VPLLVDCEVPSVSSDVGILSANGAEKTWNAVERWFARLAVAHRERNAIRVAPEILTGSASCMAPVVLNPPTAISCATTASLPDAPTPMSISVELSLVVEADAAIVCKNNIEIVSVEATAEAAISCTHAPTELAVPPDVADTMLVVDASHVSADPSKNGTGCDCRTLCDAMPRRRADGVIM
jgi:hypothetical protein